MPGRIPLESLAGIAWNPWPESNGITGRDHVESVAGIVWNLHKVVTVIEKLSSNTLDATLIANPGWTTFRDEIRANRPLISFIPGHSRTVAGYTSHRLALPGELPFKGLLVYDPWPPTDCEHPEDGGVITRWENFATQTYQYAYSAVLKHV